MESFGTNLRVPFIELKDNALKDNVHSRSRQLITEYRQARYVTRIFIVGCFVCSAKKCLIWAMMDIQSIFIRDCIDSIMAVGNEMR